MDTAPAKQKAILAFKEKRSWAILLFIFGLAFFMASYVFLYLSLASDERYLSNTPAVILPTVIKYDKSITKNLKFFRYSR
jgi:hypothetical protein